MAGVAGKKSKIKIAAATAAALILAAAILSFLTGADQFRPQIESRLSSELGRGVRLGKLRLSLFSGRLSVDDISIIDNTEFGESPFVTARAFYIGVKLRPLIFSKKVHITEIALDHPSIYLRQSPEGKWNISNLGAGRGGQAEPAAGKSGQAVDVRIERLKITGGRVEITKAGKTPAAYEKINLTVDNLSRDTASHFTLAVVLQGEDTLNLHGTFGPLNRDDTLMTPLKMTLKESGVSVDGLRKFLPPFDIMPPNGAALEGGTMYAEIVGEGFLNNLTIDGTVEITGTSLAGFDLGSKIASAAGFSGLKSGLKSDIDTQIEKLHVSVRLTVDGITVNNIQLVIPALGDISGSGTISPRQELDLAMRVAVSNNTLAAFTKGKAIEVNFFIRGSAADPEFIPDYKDAARSLIDAFLTGNDSEAGPANKANQIMDSLKGFLSR